jgi:spore coat protein SA
LHLEILGRGTYQDEVARFPARDSGMSERIHFPGYIDPADYPTRLASFDMVIFLVPGSDGTCRAAREALACGVPVISSQRGLLPSLIPETGGLLLADEKPETLTQAILSLAENSSLRQRLAQGAKKYAESVSDVNLHIDGLMADLKPFLATS